MSKINIPLGNNYILLADERQWILGKKTKKGRIRHIGFYGDLSLLLQDVALRCLRLSSASTMQELLENQKSIIAGLNKALQSLEIEVADKTKINFK